GRRARADRALTAEVVRAVGLGTAREVVQVDRALEALALGDTDDIDLVPRLEALDADRLAGLEAVDRIEADLAQVLDRGAGRLEVAQPRLLELLLVDRAVAELDPGIAVALLRPHRRDDVRLRGDHGRRDGRPVGPEVLEHADLAAEHERLGDVGRGLAARRPAGPAFVGRLARVGLRLVGHFLVLPRLELDLDVDAGRKVQLHERVDG